MVGDLSVTISIGVVTTLAGADTSGEILAGAGRRHYVSKPGRRDQVTGNHLRLDLEQDGHGTVVDQVDLHVGTEDPRGDLQPAGAQRLDDGLDQRLGHRSRRRSVRELGHTTT